MKNQDFLKNLVINKGQLINRDVLEQSKVIRVGVWDDKDYKLYGNIVTIELEMPDGNTFWTDENILGSGKITTLTIK